MRKRCSDERFKMQRLSDAWERFERAGGLLRESVDPSKIAPSLRSTPNVSGKARRRPFVNREIKPSAQD